ncbi:MAG TPA: hypothetical protein VHF50_05505 [Solirubrobacterales bacterium]|nr:hypothetical protein [Solirubrobacterales bacterium]
MRPEREDIASPDFPESLVWLGEPPGAMPLLTADGPVLVHFFDFAQLNSVRTLPYLAEWDRRYRGKGLTTIGIQSPRFPFGADRDAVGTGVRGLGIDFPVAIDAERDLWHEYGCQGWPSLFLWRSAGALTWFHFGEGDYLGTEEAVQAELRELDALRELPAPMAPLRPSDGPSARVMAPTPELFPGGSWERPWTEGDDPNVLETEYAAGGAYATIDGDGDIAVELDGRSLEAVEVAGAGLYTLVEHPRHEAHALALRPSPGLRLWSISFAAGVP